MHKVYDCIYTLTITRLTLFYGCRLKIFLPGEDKHDLCCLTAFFLLSCEQNHLINVNSANYKYDYNNFGFNIWRINNQIS